SLGWRGVAVGYTLAYFVLRFGLVWTTAVWGLRDRHLGKKLLFVPLHDAISFMVWVGGFIFNKIEWRGSVFRVRKGLLIPEVSREPAH
ncbi:MAG: hypothetical protein ACRD51_02855, partial [Candidatus Acidiferrum sp.]